MVQYAVTEVVQLGLAADFLLLPLGGEVVGGIAVDGDDAVAWGEAGLFGAAAVEYVAEGVVATVLLEAGAEVVGRRDSWQWAAAAVVRGRQGQPVQTEADVGKGGFERQWPGTADELVEQAAQVEAGDDLGKLFPFGFMQRLFSGQPVLIEGLHDAVEAVPALLAYA